jgi:hypothetical protein
MEFEVQDRAGYALLLLRLCMKRRRHALAGLLVCRPLGARLQRRKKRALVGSGQHSIPDTSLQALSFHLARLFTTADPTFAIQSHAPRV